MTLMERRRALMVQKSGGGLPAEFQQTEWVGYSTQNSFLDTGIACDDVAYIKSIIKKDSVPSSGTVFPNVTGNYWGTIENISGSKFSASPSYTKDTTFDFTEITSTKTGGSVTGRIKLGYTNGNFVPAMRYKTLELYGLNDNLLFDGVPGYMKNGTVIGMFDLVSQSFKAGYTESLGIWEKGADV